MTGPLATKYLTPSEVGAQRREAMVRAWRLACVYVFGRVCSESLSPLFLSMHVCVCVWFVCVLYGVCADNIYASVSITGHG